MGKIVSFELYSDFGFLKKPDTNVSVYLTFNMLHRPAFLGIMGAVLGLKGFSETGKLPEYYEKLNHLRISIKPLIHENGNFQKTTIKYTNGVGYANLDGGTLIVSEQTLINPAYQCYILLDNNIHIDKQLYQNLKEYRSHYIPYLGKNEFSAWWKNFKEFDVSTFTPGSSFKIDSLFIKEQPLKDGKVVMPFNPLVKQGGNFMYFENLPFGYDLRESEKGKPIFQYEYLPFAFTNYLVEQKYKVENLFKAGNEIIQLF